MEGQKRSQEAKQVTLVGAFANLFQAIIKVIVGFVGQSQSLFADGIHSFSDLLTDGLVLLASHYGSRQADLDHPYGHQRIETAATLFLALLLILAGLGIAYDSILHLVTTTYHHPKSYVLPIVVLSILINEFLYHYTLRVGQKIKSNLVIANAWHHRSDAASSVVVFIGVLGVLLGYRYLDAIAAVIVGFMIVKMGGELGWFSVRELVDTGVPPKTLGAIRSAILSVPGVIELHQLRTRCMSNSILVDAHILVNPSLSVSEGHYISSKVHEVLLNTFETIADVTIHVDPEDDEFAPLSRNLPSRAEVNATLLMHLKHVQGTEAILDTRLHYVEGKLQVELVLPVKVLISGRTPESLQNEVRDALKSIPYISKVEILFT